MRTMRLTYGLREWRYGVGQSSELSELLDFVGSRIDSTLVFGRIVGNHLPLPMTRIHVEQKYYLSVLSQKLNEILSRSDVVHVLSGLPLLVASVRCRKPTIYTLLQPDPTNLFRGTTKLGNITNWLLHRKVLLEMATALVSKSEWVAQWYREQMGIDSLIIPDSFDLSKFRPLDSPRRRPNGGFQLLSVGDWDGYQGRKRTDELIGFFKQFHLAHPDSTLNLVGLSDGAIRTLANVAKSGGLNSCVRLISKVDLSTLVEFYRAADVFVSATISEGFYRPIVEAFACGTPAVVRDPGPTVPSPCQAAKHHAKRSGAGEVFDGDSYTFCAAVEKVLANRAEYAVRALDYAKAFDSKVVMSRYTELYSDLVCGEQ
jgi:glycosyltransferase involved in cell wall biosynthesis